MSLDNESADVIHFRCAACGREHSLRQVRKRAGTCQYCQGDQWTMVTEYQDVEQQDGLMAGVTILLFGPILGAMLNRQAKMIPIETPNVPADEAMAIARAGIFKRGRLAYKYMELCRSIDGENERARLRDRGGVNCKSCSVFFVPAVDKPWTQAGYCSRRCAASAGLSVETVSPPPPPKSIEPRTTAAKLIKLNCSCGHCFEVPAMYVGTPRPCPICHKKIIVA
jgi:hypothetical protein